MRRELTYTSATGSAEPPLCVDLDHTLIWTDSLIETCLSLVLSGLSWLLIPFWLIRGKAYLKKRSARLSPLDASKLPYNETLVRDLRQQHLEGRTIILCTGAAEEIAERVGTHLGIFDDIIASDGTVNLVGSRKREALETRFGRGGFDYIGDSRRDIAIWRIARRSFVVNPSGRLLGWLRSRNIAATSCCFKPQAEQGVKLWLRAIRVHQWTKNLLVFAPLALGHRLVLFEATLAFLAFSLTASAGYLTNDLLDLEADRKHVHKRYRPLASGDLSAGRALMAIPLLLVLAGLAALRLPGLFAVTLAGYFVSSLAYSLWLKRAAPIDVILLAGLYTIRIVAGGAATHIVISPWTLAVSVFLFLSLAMVKRVAELRELRAADNRGTPGRGYSRMDIEQLSSMGGSAGYLSVLVTALYISSPDVQKLYSNPHWLWLILPVMLYWISRIWLYTGRGWIDQDPVVFALKDKTTYLAGLLSAAIAVLATT